jgi:hypothetical protein
MTLIVAEFNEQIRVVKLLDDRAYLPARKSLCGEVRQQRYHVQNGRPFVLCFHHSTQQVTNAGTLSPDRTIQIILTTALLSPDGRIERQWVPQGVYRNREGLARACGFKQGVSQPRCVVALKIKRLAGTPEPYVDRAGATGSDNNPRSCGYRGWPYRHAADASSCRRPDFTLGGFQRIHQWII